MEAKTCFLNLAIHESVQLKDNRHPTLVLHRTSKQGPLLQFTRWVFWQSTEVDCLRLVKRLTAAKMLGSPCLFQLTLEWLVSLEGWIEGDVPQDYGNNTVRGRRTLADQLPVKICGAGLKSQKILARCAPLRLLIN